MESYDGVTPVSSTLYLKSPLFESAVSQDGNLEVLNTERVLKFMYMQKKVGVSGFLSKVVVVVEFSGLRSQNEHLEALTPFNR